MKRDQVQAPFDVIRKQRANKQMRLLEHSSPLTGDAGKLVHQTSRLADKALRVAGDLAQVLWCVQSALADRRLAESKNVDALVIADTVGELELLIQQLKGTAQALADLSESRDDTPH